MHGEDVQFTQAEQKKIECVKAAIIAVGGEVKMADLLEEENLTRTDAIKCLEMFLHKQCDLARTEFAYSQITVWAAVKMAFDALAGEQWIPCSERLPFAEYGESDTVLATCGYRDVEDTNVRWTRLLYYNGGVWCYPTGECYEEKVYAWMPLPEPYKEGSK